MSPAVEGESCSTRDSGQRCGGVGHGVRRRSGRIGPVQPGALVRLQVGWRALPPDDGEEEADACLTFGAAVMNDVTEGQVSRVDQNACFPRALRGSLPGPQIHLPPGARWADKADRRRSPCPTAPAGGSFRRGVAGGRRHPRWCGSDPPQGYVLARRPLGACGDRGSLSQSQSVVLWRSACRVHATRTAAWQPSSKARVQR